MVIGTIEDIKGIKDLEKTAQELLGGSGIKVKRSYAVMPKPCYQAKDRSRFYAYPVNDFDDNALLESEDVLMDYARLCYSLNGSIRGIDISTTKIDEMFSNPYEFTTHNFHPLAVVRFAMDKGFQIAECPGPLPSNPPLCSRIKANGLWMNVPSRLDMEVRDYFRNRNRQTSGLCPVCEETLMSMYEMDRISQY